MGNQQAAKEFQFVIRFRREPRGPGHGLEVWRGQIMLVPKRASTIPEQKWAQQWVERIDEIPNAIRSLLAGAGVTEVETNARSKSYSISASDQPEETN